MVTKFIIVLNHCNNFCWAVDIWTSKGTSLGNFRCTVLEDNSKQYRNTA